MLGIQLKAQVRSESKGKPKHQDSNFSSGDYTTTKEVHNDSYPAIDPAKADLSGKAIFVSGASRGIGRCIALSYAKAGASHIAIGARSDLTTVEKDVLEAAKQAGKKAPRVLSVKLDITDPQSVDGAAQKIEKAFGRLDVVVNNAGILGARDAVGDSEPDVWWQTMNVNLRGPYMISRACLPLLLRSDLKTLISVASVGAHSISPGLSAYQTSKLALVRLTEFIAKEYADQGIVALTVHPGNVLTDIVGFGEGMDPQLKTIFTESTELCGDSLVYLTREKRDWLNGRYINVTWDMPELTSDPLKAEIIDQDKLKVRLVV